jgi:hypothetical protein
MDQEHLVILANEEVLRKGEGILEGILNVQS